MGLSIRSFLWICLFTTGILVLLAIPMSLHLFIPRLTAKAQERAIALLEKDFEQVSFQEIEVDFLPFVGLLPGIRCHGKGLQLSLRDKQMYPPFIVLEEFSVDFGILALSETPVHLKKVKFEKMQVHIPPRSGQNNQKLAGSTENRRLPNLVFEEIVADGTILRILPRDAAKQPLEFVLHRLRLDTLSPGSPMSFQAVLDNPKPPGRIETTGKFGPMMLDEPGSSAVSGEYVFTGADLSVFGGIAGTLSSEGKYTGTLGRIEVSGSTDVPDFQLKTAERQAHVKTRFEAVVDGTKGDTNLQPVKAELDGSKFEMRGGVVQEAGTKGKTVRLNAQSTEARVEDFLRLTVKADETLLTGDLRFNSEIVIPPGRADVLNKLRLQGNFDLESAHFHPQVQERIEELSEAGRGERGKREDPSSSPREVVLSDFSGDFLLGDGVMSFPNLNFSVTGAEVMLEGQYGLVDEELDFRGELLLDAKISQLTTGVKSFFLKAVDPLFSRRGAGAVIPIKISGNRDDPSFDVEIGRVFTRKDVANQPGESSE